jgi:hypothetical protein
MVIAHKIRRVDDHALAIGLAETIHFGVAADPSAAAESAGEDSTDLSPPDDTFQGMGGP